MDADSVLAATPLFSSVLDDRQRAALAAKCSFAQFAEGAVLMTEGDFGSSMFAIVDGKVEVHVDEGRGPRHVATLGHGDIVGEMSLLTGSRRTATVTAILPVTALEITKLALEPVFVASPELLDQFGEMLDRRREELARIQADARAWHILGMTREDIIASIRVFFGGR